MDNRKVFLKICSLCAMATAFTTFLLWFLPRQYEEPALFEDKIQLKDNIFYLARLWVNFIHIVLALVGYFGFLIVTSERKRIIAKLGMVWFTIWGTVEMVGVSIILFSINRTWRENYAMADAAHKVVLTANIELVFSVWDSMFFVLLIAFLLGSVFFGWAAWETKGVERLVSILFWLAVPLTIIITLSGYWGMAWGDQVVEMVYPVLQPISRFVLGIFIWKRANA